MLQYLVILLDDTSVSYCHYENTKTVRKLISTDDLKAGIFFAMKENLMIQFVYPDDELPEEYQSLIETIDHQRILPASKVSTGAEVMVLEGFEKIPGTIDKDAAYVVRTTKNEWFKNVDKLLLLLEKANRINIVLCDADTFTDADFAAYRQTLSLIADATTEQYMRKHFPQLNILTDRVLLNRMNNCNAGVENITLAPNGQFYVCPAFYYENELDTIGNLTDGIEIKNKQLYQIACSPLCRRCDAYQCRRCVWLNRKTTLEVNTPSHEQCVIAHLERNVSREWLLGMAEFFPNKEIAEIQYLDPFDIIEN